MLGEHGDTQFPLWSKIAIGGISLQEYLESMNINLDDETRLKIEHDTKTAGAEIIKRKGATYYGVAVSTCTIATSVLRNTYTMRPVGCVLDGEFGLKDVAMSVPAILNRKGAETIIEYQLKARPKRIHLSRSRTNALEHVKTFNIFKFSLHGNYSLLDKMCINNLIK